MALADVDDTPNGVPVEFGVSVADPTVTADGTARLLTGVWNTDDSLREIDPPFYKGASKWYGNPGIVLHSLRAPDSPSEDYSPGGCIEHSEASAESQSWTLEKLVFRVEPGDLVFDDLLLVDDPTVDGCVPPGEYRFESTHTVADAEFEWGFTVSVVDPFAG